MKCFAQISIATLALAAVWVGGATHASAQASSEQKILKSYEQDRIDAREAIRALFREVGVSYTIDPGVQGVVTISLKNVTFETALQNILRQIDATYLLEGGVYEIVRKSQRAALNSGPDPRFYVPVIRGEPTTTMTVDGRYLYILRDTEIYKLDKETLRMVKTGSLNEIPLVPRK